MIDAHTIAWINLVGSACTVLGALYLAYDLLGGTRGPLRTLTRVVTYSILFAAGYSIGLGLVYGLTAGAGLGLALAIELRSLGALGIGITIFGFALQSIQFIVILLNIPVR